MDQTLSALGDILLKALPTFFLVIGLYIYLRKIFFKPLGSVLDARRDATEGARKRAEEMLRKADQKAAECESALQSARAEIFREHEAERQKGLEAQALRVREARAQAEAQLRQARERLAGDVAAAQQALEAQADMLAEQVIQAALGKGAAA